MLGCTASSAPAERDRPEGRTSSYRAGLGSSEVKDRSWYGREAWLFDRRWGGPAKAAMTHRHDALWAGFETKTMEAPERPLPDQQIADLAALKVTSELRQSLPHGSSEWLQALREETGLIARVLASVGQRSGDLRPE